MDAKASVPTQTSRYAVDLTHVGSVLAARFVQLGADEHCVRFTDAARSQPHSRTKTWLHRALRSFVSDYDVNGLLGMYRMHLLSTPQWERLLESVSRASLLDVGAGDGGLTRHLSCLFERTTATESSWAMARRLRRAGYTCIRGDIGTQPATATYSCVSCLNVLDRTPFPLRLLSTMGQLTLPGGSLVVASPLPLDAFYYRGPRTLVPKQRLHAPGPTWEQAAGQLVRAIESQLPQWRLLSWSRAPYVSWGDADKDLYELDDFIGVWQRPADGPRQADPPAHVTLRPSLARKA